ncbi:hypothetical protein C8D88_101669 [Lentzea atacamensis]|uniref:Uncharacterized protein n=1 Tax=Lentzea atacamensis TaxID=531938 RepID=A0A316IBS3_9PSEU|nr:hypothetical protein [Lentzea atacamensis]PWK90651.1 hypothetical protein C8D88_101669 [Lentzea atacamensis]
MGDLLKDLARTRPSTPDVDPERMERDLARITSLPSPRDWAWAPSFTRRFGPVLVAFAAAVLLVLAILPSDRTRQFADPQPWWHVLTRNTSLLLVGDPANPYVMRMVSDTDEWFAPGRHVKVSQLSGLVAPKSANDDARWVTAGAPMVVPIVGMNHNLRVGQMRPGAWKDDISTFGTIPYEEIGNLFTDVSASGSGVRPPREPGQMMRLAIAPLRDDQRQALLALLRTSARDLGRVTLPDGRVGVGVALAPVESQFGTVEEQLVVDERTAQPIVHQQVLTTSRHGLPAGTPIWSEEYLHLGLADGATGPPDVNAIGEPVPPIVKR